MITATIPVKMNPANLHGPDEFEDGISLAIQNDQVYVVVKTFGTTMVHSTQVCLEDL